MPPIRRVFAFVLATVSGSAIGTMLGLIAALVL